MTHVDGLSVLLTRRTETMSSFRGHLSFPGGRIDPHDPHPLAAALRESHEEIGLEAKDVEVLGFFTQLPTHIGTLVLCYAGLVDPEHAPTKPASAHEVDEILQVRIVDLLKPTGQAPGPNHYAVTDYEGRVIGIDHAPSRTLHYWTLTSPHHRRKTILWGLTAELLSQMLRRGFGWTPPTPPRTIERVEDFQP